MEHPGWSTAGPAARPPPPQIASFRRGGFCGALADQTTAPLSSAGGGVWPSRLPRAPARPRGGRAAAGQTKGLAGKAQRRAYKQQLLSAGCEAAERAEEYNNDYAPSKAPGC